MPGLRAEFVRPTSIGEDVSTIRKPVQFEFVSSTSIGSDEVPEGEKRLEGSGRRTFTPRASKVRRNSAPAVPTAPVMQEKEEMPSRPARKHRILSAPAVVSITATPKEGSFEWLERAEAAALAADAISASSALAYAPPPYVPAGGGGGGAVSVASLNDYDLTELCAAVNERIRERAAQRKASEAAGGEAAQAKRLQRHAAHASDELRELADELNRAFADAATVDEVVPRARRPSLSGRAAMSKGARPWVPMPLKAGVAAPEPEPEPLATGGIALEVVA